MFEYPIHKNYVKHWGIWEGAREFFQNAMDSGKYHHSYQDGTLSIMNPGTLSRDKLLLGKTDKNVNKRGDKRGQYGEGFKFAMLVFARMGRAVRIYTGSELWEPKIIDSTIYEDEVLAIDVIRCNMDQVMVELEIRYNEYKEIMNKIIEGIRDSSTPYGIIGKGGKIYVGGLYVCRFPKLKYSYNFTPKDVGLTRDRSLPSLFDIQWVAGQYLDGEQIIDIAQSDKVDVSDYNGARNDKKIAKAWTTRYGNTMPIGINEQDKIKSKKFRIVPDWLAKAVRSMVDFVYDYMKSPKERLNDWIAKNKSYLRSEEVKELENILVALGIREA